jgi:hypothetical protein
MSLPSLILSLVLFPLKPKPAPPPKKDQSPNGPTARELELEAELERATFALSTWRSSWHALWAENERLRAQRQARTNPLQTSKPDHIFQNLTQLQHYQAQQTRLHALAQHHLADYESKFGPDHNPDCAPARTSLLKPDALEC